MHSFTACHGNYLSKGRYISKVFFRKFLRNSYVGFCFKYRIWSICDKGDSEEIKEIGGSFINNRFVEICLTVNNNLVNADSANTAKIFHLGKVLLHVLNPPNSALRHPCAFFKRIVAIQKIDTAGIFMKTVGLSLPVYK